MANASASSPSAVTRENVRVSLRFRPDSRPSSSPSGKGRCVRVESDETNNGGNGGGSGGGGGSVVSSSGGGQRVIIGRGPGEEVSYGFPRIFDEKATQTSVYQHVASPLVNELLSGKNCSIVTYGQSSTGKTYTMLGKRLLVGSDAKTGDGYGMNEAGGNDHAHEEEEEDGADERSAISSLSSCGVSEKKHRASPNKDGTGGAAAQAGGGHKKPPLQVYAGRNRSAGGGGGGVLPAGDLYHSSVQSGLSAASGPALGGAAESDGIVPRTVHGIFTALPRRRIRRSKNFPSPVALMDHGQSGDEFVLWCSYAEIDSMERVYDLLSGEEVKLDAEQDEGNGDVLDRLSERICVEEADAIKAIEEGNARRISGAVGSSRSTSISHRIIVIKVERYDQATDTKLASRMVFADLAGSNVLNSKNPDSRSLSRSISALGNIIYALSEDTDPAHVPYGVSSLTRALRGALGGNSITSLILTASSRGDDLDETVSTIRFGQRAKHISCRVSCNSVVAGSSPTRQAPEDLLPQELGEESDSRELLEEDGYGVARADHSPPRAEGESDLGGGEGRIMGAIQKMAVELGEGAEEDGERKAPASVRWGAIHRILEEKDTESDPERALQSLSLLPEPMPPQAPSSSALADAKNPPPVKGASKLMELELTVARNELAAVSELLRSSARKMEREMSAAKEELVKSIGPGAPGHATLARFGSSGGGGSSGDLSSGPSGRPSSSLVAAAREIESDVEAAKKEIAESSPQLNGARNESDASETRPAKKGAAVSGNVNGHGSEFRHRGDGAQGRDSQLQNGEHAEDGDIAIRELRDEVSRLKRENEELRQKQKRTDEKLSKAKDKINILTLRAEEAERLLRKEGDHSDRRFMSNGDENIGVSNIVRRGSVASDDSGGSSAKENVPVQEPIHVCLRLRPLSKIETSRRSRSCVEVHEGSKNFTVDSPLDGEYDFSFDKVFDRDEPQEDVYEYTGQKVVSSLLNGVNTCIMAYGLSGSGKTHTLVGPPQNEDDADGDGSGSEPSRASATPPSYDKKSAGIAPRLIKDLFKAMKEAPASTEFIVKCSFVAVYMERLFDLLDSHTKKSLYVREHSTGVQVVGASEAFCFDESDVMALIQRGGACQSVLARRLAMETNRIHSVFVLKVQQRDTVTGQLKLSQLFLADLAGFEMTSKSKGQSMQEIKIVHKSFAVLGNVIKSLTEGSAHAPYRESKLTCLLKDTLGGNCKTFLFITASPSSYNISDTINTIRLGQRMRRIVNLPCANIDYGVEKYKKWLMASEVRMGELSSFVTELANGLIEAAKKGDVSSVRELTSGPTWASIQAIVEGEDKENNPCRRALCLGKMEELQSSGPKWRGLSLELSRRLPLDDLAEAIKARDRAETYWHDIQSEVVVLRRQNELLVRDKRKREEELWQSTKAMRELTVQKSEVEHSLGLIEFREKEAVAFIQYLRRFCWFLQKDFALNRSAEIKEITSCIPGAPDLNDLVDLDAMLIEAGLIETKEITDGDDDDKLLGLDGGEDGDDDVDSTPDEDVAENGRDSEKENPLFGRRGLIGSIGASVFSPRNKDADVSTKQEKPNLSSEMEVGFPSSGRERRLRRDLRKMANKCIELQIVLNKEQETLDMLTNRSGALNKRRIAQDAVALQKERDRLAHDIKAAVWKLHEMHLVNKALSKKEGEASQQATFLEEGFQKLQETFRKTVLESLESDAQLRERVAELDAMVDSLTVPQSSAVEIDALSRPVPRINTPIHGTVESGTDVSGDDMRRPFAGTEDAPVHKPVGLIPYVKDQENTPRSHTRRKAKFVRRSKRTETFFGRCKRGSLQLRRGPMGSSLALPLFQGDLLAIYGIIKEQAGVGKSERGFNRRRSLSYDGLLG